MKYIYWPRKVQSYFLVVKFGETKCEQICISSNWQSKHVARRKWNGCRKWKYSNKKEMYVEKSQKFIPVLLQGNQNGKKLSISARELAEPQSRLRSASSWMSRWWTYKREHKWLLPSVSQDFRHNTSQQGFGNVELRKLILTCWYEIWTQRFRVASQSRDMKLKRRVYFFHFCISSQCSYTYSFVNNNVKILWHVGRC
jgi:hypothetical protein